MGERLIVLNLIAILVLLIIKIKDYNVEFLNLIARTSLWVIDSDPRKVSNVD